MRPRLPLGLGVAAALLAGAIADDASAAALGGVATSLGLLAALSAIFLLKVWQAHVLIGSLSTLVGMLALTGGAMLIWRLRATLTRGSAVVLPPGLVCSGVAEPTGTNPISLPYGVDRRTLVDELRGHFIELQKAWDHNAREQLLGLTTPDMLDELCAARAVRWGVVNCTEVVTLNVHLVAFEEFENAQVVCVEFSGMIRESAQATATPFRELWLLTRARGVVAGWRLARHQAML